MVKHISDRVAVLYLGTLVELTTSEELYANPRHPVHTGTALRDSDSGPESRGRARPQKSASKARCRARSTRSRAANSEEDAKYAKDICRQQMPELKDVGNNHFVACHFCDALEENKGIVKHGKDKEHLL